jgi:hypothetical protein
MERRTDRLRRFFSLATPRRRDLAAVAVALAVLPALVAVAAAQPVVVHRQWITERLDAQAFIVFDTSQSMSARDGPSSPTRLDRAKREAKQVIRQLGDIPVGIATMTDRVLPDVMPTTDLAVVVRTLDVSVGINEPPPIERYPGRATTLQALYPISNNNMFPPEVKHPLLVIFTDGEASPLPHHLGYAIAQQLTIPPLFVHVWGPNEHDLGSLMRAIRSEAGTNPARTRTLGYARSALGPWFLLAGIVPLGFLLYRRNL